MIHSRELGWSSIFTQLSESEVWLKGQVSAMLGLFIDGQTGMVRSLSGVNVSGF